MELVLSGWLMVLEWLLGFGLLEFRLVKLGELEGLLWF